MLRPYASEAPAEGRGGRGGEGDGRLTWGVQGSQTVELLNPAPFMKALEPMQYGRVWELTWLDFPAGGASLALEAYDGAMLLREKYSPVVGCWSVAVGPVLDRVYLLTPFKDWDHRQRVSNELRLEEGWPPALPMAATAGGSKLLLAAGISNLR